MKWGVTVKIDGEDVLTLSSDGICGKAEMSEHELQAIRDAGQELIDFAGDGFSANPQDANIPFLEDIRRNERTAERIAAQAKR